jgi:hypothetical protein
MPIPALLGSEPSLRRVRWILFGAAFIESGPEPFLRGDRVRHPITVQRTNIVMKSLSLYVEAFTFEESKEALNLLSVLSEPMMPSHLAPKVKVQVGERRRTIALPSVRNLVSKLPAKFNDAEILYRCPDGFSMADGVRVNSITVYICISPSNEVWLSTSEWGEVRSGTPFRELLTSRSKEVFVQKRDGLFPSYFAALWDLNILNVDTAYERIFDLFCRSIDIDFLSYCCCIGGGVDVFDDNVRNYDILTPRLSKLILAYPELIPRLGRGLIRVQPLMLVNPKEIEGELRDSVVVSRQMISNSGRWKMPYCILTENSLSIS